MRASSWRSRHNISRVYLGSDEFKAPKLGTIIIGLGAHCRASHTTTKPLQCRTLVFSFPWHAIGLYPASIRVVELPYVASLVANGSPVLVLATGAPVLSVSMPRVFRSTYNPLSCGVDYLLLCLRALTLVM